MRRRAFVALTLVVALTTACALSLKEKASTARETARTALVAVDDLERQLCGPDPSAPNHCLNPDASTIGLTNARHQAISRALVDAFTADKKVAAAILQWRAGDPAPADLSALLKDATDTFGVVQGFLPTTNTLFQKIRHWLDEVNVLVDAFTGGGLVAQGAF